MDVPAKTIAGPKKFIQIGRFQVTYTFSDKLWNATLMDETYARLMREQDDAVPPPLEWYALNKLGHPSYSISRDKTTVKNHLRGTNPQGSKRENGRIRFTFHQPATGAKKTVYLNEILAAIFSTPKQKHKREPATTKEELNSSSLPGEVSKDLQIQGFEPIYISSAGRINAEHYRGFGRANAQGFMEVNLKTLAAADGNKGNTPSSEQQDQARPMMLCRVDELVMLAFHGTEKIQRWKQEGRTLHHLHGNSMDNDLRTMAYLHQVDQASVAGASREALTVLHNTIHELHAQGKMGYYHACDLLKFHFGPPLRQ
jgi:hypothetical protein